MFFPANDENDEELEAYWREMQNRSVAFAAKSNQHIVAFLWRCTEVYSLELKFFCSSLGDYISNTKQLFVTPSPNLNSTESTPVPWT